MTVATFGLPAVDVIPKVDLVELDVPPQPLDEDVVERASSAIH